MTDRLHLQPKHRRALDALLRNHLPDVEVWAYGSRVTGHSHDGSDLDLVLRAAGLKEIPAGKLADFEDAVRESTIPFLVEARDWARLPDRFHQEIERNYVVISGSCTPESESGAKAVQGWRRRDVEDLIHAGSMTIGDGYRAKNSELSASGLPFARAGNISDGFRFSGVDRFPEDELHKVGDKSSRPGDVVFTSKGTVGRFAYVSPKTERFVYSPQLCYWRSLNHEVVDPYFLYCWMRGAEFRGQFTGVAGQTDMAEYVSLTDQRRMFITLPSLPEQRTIAHILGTLDDKMDLNRRMNATLETIAQTLFKSWFVDFAPVRAKMEGHDTGLPKHTADHFPCRLVASEIGEVPIGWAVAPLSHIIDVNPTRRLRKGQMAPYLDMANMPTTGHMPHDVIDRPFGSGMRFTNGDTLVARITPCLENGKTAYVDFLQSGDTGWGSTEYLVMRPKPPLPTQFAYCLARSAHFRGFLIRNMSGTSGRQRVPASALSQFMCISPPEYIAQAFAQIVQPVMRRASVAGRESRRLSTLRDALLPRLIAGELRINRFTEEPA